MVAWRLNRPIALAWRRWADEWVVFDAGSGDTLHLDPIAAVTLMCLEAEPFDLSALAAQVAIELDLPAGETLSTKLEEVLGNFAHLGLIEPISS
jgi:PqqD family protein of HPr-rel-A system